MFIASTHPSRRPGTSRGVPGVFKCPYQGRIGSVWCPDCSSLNYRL